MVLASKAHPNPSKFLSKKAKIQHRGPPFCIVLSSLAACPWRHSVQRETGGTSKRSWYNHLLVGTVSNLLHIFSFSFCKEKMPTCSILDCNNRFKNIRGITFNNLPAKKTRLAKQWLDQLRRDESFGFPKPENMYVRNLSKRSKGLHVLRCRKSLHIAPQGDKIKVDKTGQNEVKGPI